MILVFSDLHFGSLQSNITIEKLKKIVEEENPVLVIFAGDTVDLYVKRENIKYLEMITRVVPQAYFLKGNHDPLIKIQHKDLRVNNVKIKVMHGNEFDKTPSWLDNIMVKINEFVLKYTGFNLHSFLKRILEKQFPEGKFYPPLYKVREKTINKYKNLVDIIIVGHTHYAEISRHENLTYVNVGDWKTYVKIHQNSYVEIKKI